MAAIAAVLALYDPEIIRRVTDPRTGISTTEKFRTFMPNSGELKAYCDAEQAQRDRVKRLGQMPAFRPRAFIAAPIREPRNRGNLFVGPDKPGYQKMIEWSQTAEPIEYRFDNGGIWVPLDVYLEHRGGR